jgi:hypothetical protein
MTWIKCILRKWVGFSCDCNDVGKESESETDLQVEDVSYFEQLFSYAQLIVDASVAKIQ